MISEIVVINRKLVALERKQKRTKATTGNPNGEITRRILETLLQLVDLQTAFLDWLYKEQPITPLERTVALQKWLLMETTEETAKFLDVSMGTVNRAIKK